MWPAGVRALNELRILMVLPPKRPLVRRWTAAPLLVAVLASAPVAEAQGARERGYLLREPPATLTVFGGYALPGASSELFALTYEQLTAEKGDFAGFDGGLDLALRLTPRLDMVLGIARTNVTHRSEFRDWVDQDDQPILQRTNFRRMPLSATLRIHLTERGQTVGSYAWIPSAVDPWIGLGGGAMKYRFLQAGDFVDFETLEIFSDRFESQGWAPFLQLGAGAGFNVTPLIQVSTELRYVRGGGKLDDPFEGFDRLDLSALSTAVGLTFRF
jgi:opacity protein-like surface antigen